MFEDSTLEFGSPKPKSALLENAIARLYLKKMSIGPKAINTIVHIKNLLQLKGIFEDEIEEVMLSEGDLRLPEIIEKAGKDEFPLVFIQDTCVGTVNDLEDWVVSEKLDSLLERVYASLPSRHNVKNSSTLEKHMEEVKQQKQLLEDEMEKAEQQQNFEAVEELKNSVFLLDRDLLSMNKLYTLKEGKASGSDPNHLLSGSAQFPKESLLSSATSTTAPSNVGGLSSWMKGVTSAISSVSNLLPWGYVEPVSTSPPKEYKDDRSGYVEFEVMQINWYWRQQRRILRFSKDRFLRINPLTKELRAVHYYRTIQEIVVTGKTFMTITFNDASHPEYYQSIDIDKIVSVVTDQAHPTVIPVRNVEE